MEKILCDFQIGNLYHNVYVKRDDGKPAQKQPLRLEDIPNFIKEQNIKNVFIKGAPAYGETVENRLPPNKFTFFYMNKKRKR